MQICKDVGKIEQLFEWNVILSGPWQDHEDICYTSPHFHSSDSSWCMMFGTQHKGWIGLFLKREDSGSPINITYALGISTTGGDKTFTKTHTFERNNVSSGEPKLLKLSEMNSSFNNGPYQVKITCRINKNSSASLHETPNSVSCAIQRTIPDSLSCAVQKEISDSVSSANQTETIDSVSCMIQTERLDSVSCMIQTERLDSFSCAIQTEIPDSGTDKENSEEENWSSLDKIEVTILRDCMKELLTNGKDHDVTIYVQDKEFRAHRSILSTRCPVFAMMLNHDTKENNTGTIRIEDCDPESFDEFLLYVYTGRTENLSPSKALQLYYTADKYDFPVLKERCVCLLKTFLSTTTICDVILLAAEHQEKELLKVATEFFARNVKAILVTIGWQNFMAQNPVEANELYIKSMEILLPRK